MKSFSFHPTVLIRVPYFAYTKHKSLPLQAFLDLTAVQNAQLTAAPTFYDILKKTGFKAAILQAKQRQTVENYLNRMHYRCTPFGLFAGTLPANWADHNTEGIVIGASRIAQTLPGFGIELMALDQLKQHLHTSTAIRYFSNPASILVGNEMRYLTVSNDQSKDSIREYKLKSITVDKSIKELWSFCSRPLTAAAIIEYFSQQYEMNEEESNAFLQNLADEQILLSDLEPNITGTGYSERLSGIVKDNNNGFLSLSRSLAVQASATEPLPDAFETRFEDPVRSNCYAHVGMQALEDHKSISHQYQEQISEGFYAIHKMQSIAECADLESFKTAFIDKFDQRCIPLLEALDPELGINYAGLSNAQDNSGMLDKLDGKNGSSLQKNIQWSDAHAMLLQKWQSAKNSKDPIVLDEEAIEKLPSSDQPFPTSISTIFKVHNDHIVLETIGGATSTSISGRFSIFHKETEDCCKDSANTEIEMNPGVLFAEIVSIQDTHAANIEKRKPFYHFEIPILTTSLLSYERQIQLNDLYVMIRGNRIILFSVKYGKEVIPRLSTAFNSKRCTLGIYRFLCDLQLQGIRKIAPFQMDRFFPGLPFYPRVVYKKTILQLAIWHLQKEEIQHILNEKNPCRKVLQLSEYLKELNIPAVFALKEHDNQLVFKMDDPNDLLSFADNIKSLGCITVEEFPFTETDALVKDEEGQPYQHQIVATLINNATVYQGSQLQIQRALSTLGSNNESFMPGSHWVYLKIYCHQSFGDTLLVKKIKPLLKQIKGLGEVGKWFFVRYTDPGFHLRVRIFIPPAMQGAALELLNQSLKKELNAGLISKIQLDTYKPEWERYGHHLLPPTEDCFYYGSEWMLQLLQLQHRGQRDNTEIAMINIHTIFNIAATSISDRKDLLLKMHQSLFAEHALHKQDQIELGNKYRNYRERMSLWLLNGDRKTKAQTDFEKSLHRCFSKMEKSSLHLKNTWIADLIHMQLNRAFADQARKKEMVIYYLMSKWYLSEEKKSFKIATQVLELV